MILSYCNIGSNGLPYFLSEMSISAMKNTNPPQSWTDWRKAALHYNTTDLEGNSTVSLHLRKIRKASQHPLLRFRDRLQLHRKIPHKAEIYTSLPSFIVTSTRQMKSQRNYSQAARLKKQKQEKP